MTEFNSYADLRAVIKDWLNRSDLDDQIPMFIDLAESTLNRVLRDSRMYDRDTVTLTDGEGDLPDSVLELMYAQNGTANTEPLEQVNPQQLIMLRRSRCRAAGTPRFFAIVGRKIMVAPIPSAGSASVRINFFRKIPPLRTAATTNWLLEQAPHIYLYTALMHAAPFLKDDARTAMYQSMVTQQIADAVRADQSLTLDALRTPGFSLNSPNDGPPQQAL